MAYKKSLEDLQHERHYTKCKATTEIAERIKKLQKWGCSVGGFQDEESQNLSKAIFNHSDEIESRQAHANSAMY